MTVVSALRRYFVVRNRALPQPPKLLILSVVLDAQSCLKVQKLPIGGPVVSLY